MVGGKREGAGRKKGVHNKATAEIKDILDQVVDFKVVAKKLYELTKGVTVRKTEKNGEEVIYDKPPDAFAAKILLEYRFGKAPQPITGDSNNPVEVVIRTVS